MKISNITPNNNYFFRYTALIVFSFWVFDSSIHFYLDNDINFELIPSDTNEIWERVFIALLFVTLSSLYVNYATKKTIKNRDKHNKAVNISIAKKQWELIVDTLPQLIIAIDDNAKITRVNRTIEKWGIGKVNKVNGLNVTDFLLCLNINYSSDVWIADWSNIWLKIQNDITIERVIENKYNGTVYQYTLKRVTEYDKSKDLCYAILTIDDITAQKYTENSLKSRAMLLEKTVTNRTKELKHANNQLALELESKQSINEELIHSQKCRLALLRNIFTAQEDERKRISRELHDSISQSLGATKFRLEETLINKVNNQIVVGDTIGTVINNLKTILEDVRNISMDLRPAMIDDLGAISTLTWFCREFQNTYSTISVKQIFNVDESMIHDKNKIVIFRIAQEAMNNIVKHANATEITLELSYSSSGLSMSITDNGCGFNNSQIIKKGFNTDSQTPNCSFGLTSMRERAESTNGLFFIQTTPNVGTRIHVLWEA